MFQLSEVADRVMYRKVAGLPGGFLYLYKDPCAALEETWAIGFAGHLDEIAPGASALCQTLQNARFAAPPDTPEEDV